MEDPSLIRHVKASFLEIPYSIKLVETSDLSTGDKRSNECIDFDTVFDTELIPVIGALDVASPNISSSGFDPEHLAEDAFLIGGLNGAVSQAQSWQFVDDEFSNSGAHCSMNSSDCISQTFVEPVKVVSTLKGEKRSDQRDPREVALMEPRSDDVHYQSIISSILKSHHHLILGPHFRRGRQESSFMSWRKEGMLSSRNSSVSCVTPQRVLKKILFEVPWMHGHGLLECPEENAKKDGVSMPESDQIHLNQMSSDRPERELLSERFYALKAIIPSTDKVFKFLLLIAA